MIACPKCHIIQPVANINTGSLHACPGCRNLIRADVFRAFTGYHEYGKPDESILVSGQAECFYHAGKKAFVACDACGRLLCTLCQVEFNGRNLCMRCLQAGRDKQKIKTLQQQRVLNESIAFHLAFWPILMIFPTLLTAPVAVFFSIRHWRTPAAVLPRSFAKSILAFLLATGQIIGWVVFFIIKF